MKKIIDWHYTRSDLASTYLDSLATGLMGSIVLFAPRKKGKTEFLRDDLAPAAEQRDYRVVYCSMWENRNDPLSALNIALADAAKPRNLKQRIGKVLSTPLSGSVEVGVPTLGNLKANITDAAKPEAVQQAILNLPGLMDAAIKASGGKLLLALDEVQHLAKPEFHDMVAALRTCLDMRKKHVHSIFTGSSRNRLQAMFSHIKAPLFQFSQTTNFPDLGNSFVDFMSATFFAATNRTLPVKKARDAFAATGNTPGLYREALLALMVAGGTDIVAAVQSVLDQSRNNSGYAEQFELMRALDREVVFSVIEKSPLYSTETLKRFSDSLGLEVTARQVQAAIERLQVEQVIYRQDVGDYEIEDPQLVEWVKYMQQVDSADTATKSTKRD
jgi:hypothetical protein